jgi:hypothetical protein
VTIRGDSLDLDILEKQKPFFEKLPTLNVKSLKVCLLYSPPPFFSDKNIRSRFEKLLPSCLTSLKVNFLGEIDFYCLLECKYLRVLHLNQVIVRERQTSEF